MTLPPRRGRSADRPCSPAVLLAALSMVVLAGGGALAVLLLATGAGARGVSAGRALLVAAVVAFTAVVPAVLGWLAVRYRRR
ncbi:MAG TPA: hypothetical protein VFY17_11930 [Pilimelia sp.]|nr:hypothetical protein [Pilimelia sp.]